MIAPSRAPNRVRGMQVRPRRCTVGGEGRSSHAIEDIQIRTGAGAASRIRLRRDRAVIHCQTRRDAQTGSIDVSPGSMSSRIRSTIQRPVRIQCGCLPLAASARCKDARKGRNDSQWIIVVVGRRSSEGVDDDLEVDCSGSYRRRNDSIDLGAGHKENRGFTEHCVASAVGADWTSTSLPAEFATSVG